MSDIKEISKNIIIELNRIEVQEKTQFFVKGYIDLVMGQIELVEIYETKMIAIIDTLNNHSFMTSDQIISQLVMLHHYINEYANLIKMLDRVMMQYIKNTLC